MVVIGGINEAFSGLIDRSVHRHVSMPQRQPTARKLIARAAVSAAAPLPRALVTRHSAGSGERVRFVANPQHVFKPQRLEANVPVRLADRR